ncbi:hypothetical protein ERHA54_50200 (plasmid) [Erwinia rhapontici]|nr:hypothetical protein ERHA54_50200 [Erwinia rhapontici]
MIIIQFNKFKSAVKNRDYLLFHFNGLMKVCLFDEKNRNSATK